MLKVGFYINNKYTSKVDCSSIIDGNPAIGGTGYLFYLTAYLLGTTYKNDLYVNMMVSTDCILPPDMPYQVVKDKNVAISLAEKDNYDVLVVKYEEMDFYEGVYDNDELKVKIVIWAHNIIPNHILRKISKTKSITCVVNVGREQLDLYRDSKAFLKSTFIYNGVNVMPKEYYLANSIPFDERKNEVTYLGSLIPIKGFHLLAQAWPKIIKEVPDAHLNVIGSGKLYNENAKLGKYGIADEEYENVFMKYLTDSCGNVIPSVTFHGKMGKEKDVILGRTKVGVPNPSGSSETFCLSAIEMELFQCRIVTKRYVGFLDTVPSYAGVLYENDSQLSQFVIDELRKNNNLQYNKAYYYINENFSIMKIIGKWYNLFNSLVNNTEWNIITNNVQNKDYNLKKYREINRLIKSSIPFGYVFPTVDMYVALAKKLVK